MSSKKSHRPQIEFNSQVIYIALQRVFKLSLAKYDSNSDLSIEVFMLTSRMLSID